MYIKSRIGVSENISKKIPYAIFGPLIKLQQLKHGNSDYLV